ncbi:MAG: DNA-binding protein [Candidatus Entotheonella gemina]|uniref:DNA-binding protein n=1 Tax=Candidatus Entotheonella gemina TaxID=1429439 RepID=W4LB65_9BACT|nr:MAG: DNA-binding protein [Candidatus Entotheonella gemina]
MRREPWGATMNATVYIETSIIGYLTSRPSRGLITAANQQLTYDWWHEHRQQFDLFVSQFVIDECAAGDVVAAKERLDVLVNIRQLEVTEAVESLAQALLDQVPLPGKAQVDALHIATATIHGMEYLLTWNCTHIANAILRPRVEAICRSLGYEPPTICTPQELMED